VVVTESKSVLVAPLLKDFKFGKSLKIKHFRDFLFLRNPPILAKLSSSIGLNRGHFFSHEKLTTNGTVSR
jgi:hypothetical protein